MFRYWKRFDHGFKGVMGADGIFIGAPPDLKIGDKLVVPPEHLIFSKLDPLDFGPCFCVCAFIDNVPPDASWQRSFPYTMRLDS